LCEAPSGPFRQMVPVPFLPPRRGISAAWPRRPTMRMSVSVTATEIINVNQGEPPTSGPKGPAQDARPAVTLADLQQLIRNMYLRKDVARGVEGTFMWLLEEIGELAAALRSGTHEEKSAEFADVLAWLTTIANVAGVDLTEAVVRKYGAGCPGCGQLVCTCPDAGKP
jgi:NTP pyrophosphatase (non-canonical NTP hydrolase)